MISIERGEKKIPVESKKAQLKFNSRMQIETKFKTKQNEKNQNEHTKQTNNFA